MTNHPNRGKISKALAVARDRVSMIAYGNRDYVVQTWSPRHNATWQSDHMDYHRAAAHAKEARIRTALEQMGIEDADAQAASLCDSRDGRWDTIVRDFINATK